MKIFIAGASGLLGGNCLKHFTEQGCGVTGSHFSHPTSGTVYLNTLDTDHPDNFNIVEYAPEVIVHCGALTHVDYCETHEEESYTQTVQSTINLIGIAKECKARMVYISTDYVFDGTAGPYEEDAVVNPVSVYGRHKLEAEQMVLKEIDQPLILRITNVYGDESRGKNFVARIIRQCKDGQRLQLKLPYDQFATPTNAWDIARAMYLLLCDSKTGIYHTGSTDYMNRIELALRVLQYFPQAAYDLLPTSTTELNQPAARPLKGGFVCMKLRREYPEFLFSNLDDYMKKIGSR